MLMAKACLLTKTAKFTPENGGILRPVASASTKANKEALTVDFGKMTAKKG